MKRYRTETERIANEVFDRAMREWTLSHAKFYVNGQPWRPGEEIPSPRLRIASRQEQEDFWAHIPQEPIYVERRGFWSLLPRRQMGLGRARIDWRRVRVYFALFGLSLGILLAIAIGIREMWEAFK